MNTQLLSQSILTACSIYCLLTGSLRTQAASTESNLSKTFAVKPGGRLLVDADRGSVDVRTAEGNEVAIEVQRKVEGSSGARAEEIFAAHKVVFDQKGDEVSVVAKSTRDLENLLKRGRPNLQVNYRITVPTQFNLDLRTAAGSISCGDIEGSVKARTSGGSLKFGHIKGPVDANTAAGSITLLSASEPVKVKSSGGSIRIDRVESETSAETSAGSITVGMANGKLKAKSGGGGIDLGTVSAPAEVDTAAGSIHVKSAQARVGVKTSGGSITIDDARNAVVAHSSAGSIEVRFSAQPEEDCRLTTSGGAIEVRLAEDLGLDVDAETGGGQVTTNLPITSSAADEHKTGKLKGKINGGGHLLLLKTGAGNIRLRKR